MHSVSKLGWFSIVSVLSLGTITTISAQEAWQFVRQVPAALTLAKREPWVQPVNPQLVKFDRKALIDDLEQMPLESSPKTADILRVGQVITIPGPGQRLQRFRVVETEVMHPDLAAKFPEIRTFRGIGIDDKFASLRMDLTPQGFHAQVLSPSDSYYIDPYFKNDDTVYTCYHKRDLGGGKNFTCGQPAVNNVRQLQAAPTELPPALTTGSVLRTYRLAVTGQGEYTQFHGGSVMAMAAIVTTINRVNGIYERDLAVRLQLIPNNNLIIYSNPATDPFTANDSSSTTLAQNQTNTDSVIGSGNYDVGHIFNTGGGGLAGLGVVCLNSQKAEGATGSSNPVGDGFDVDFVAHELGHQFGADHTYNGTEGSCGDSRNASTAFERGSGSTIMAYAGICDNDDVQSAAGAYFHFTSIEEITTYLNTQSCEVGTATGNSLPTVNAGLDYIIPAQTPFALTVSANDANSDDTLTYSWEQMDLGPAQALSAADNGSSPLFRSFSPSTDPSRTFPRLSNLVTNTNDDAEKLPTTTRFLNFRVTARDNRAGGGGTGSDDMRISVISGAGPFQVIYPNTSLTLQGVQTVTWNAANTAASPVSTPNVNILLSLDGGNTFPTVLAANVPNDGAETITLPSLQSSQARIKIEGAGNIFFDISNTNFSIEPDPSLPFFIEGSGHVIDDTLGTGNENNTLDPGETGLRLFLNLKNDSTNTATGVSAVLTSLTPTVSVKASTSTYPDLGANQTNSNNSVYVLDLDSSHPCGVPVLLQLAVTSDQVNRVFELSLPTGSLAAPVVRSFNVSSTIPDGSTIDIPFTIPDTGTLADVNFRFDGSTCSTDSTSALVGLNHPYVGDLTATLISPAGTEVVLLDRPGGGDFGSSGSNFCHTLFDDDGAFTSIQAIAENGSNAPHTGTWLPANPLSAFDGENPNGQWKLRIRDNIAPDAGRLNSFSLVITMIECSPPSLTAYDQWAQVSGLSGNQALFDSDANYDGVPNGVAFYFGAANAQTVTSGLIPSWQTVTIDNIEYQTVVFQRIDSAADHMATVRHSANLKDWADAEHGVDGVTITIIDDGFGTGVDKIVVNIPLNGATRRFSRILVTSP